MRNNTGGCLTAFTAFFSRMVLLVFWISRPVAWNATFSTAILPCLGFLFLPFTTMVYAWLMQGVGGIQGADWLWLGLALFSDVATIASAGYANRQAIPGYPSWDDAAPGGQVDAGLQPRDLSSPRPSSHACRGPGEDDHIRREQSL